MATITEVGEIGAAGTGNYRPAVGQTILILESSFPTGDAGMCLTDGITDGPVFTAKKGFFITNDEWLKLDNSLGIALAKYHLSGIEW